MTEADRDELTSRGPDQPAPLGDEDPSPDQPQATDPEQPEPTDPAEPGTDLAELAEADPRSREELFAELVEAEARRDEYLEDLRRARAEFENYRKRVMREGATQRETGRSEVASALLEVLDDLDRTLDAAQESTDEHLARGVELVAGKLVHVLQGLGIQRIDELGAVFDPTRHEAVQHREAEQPREQPVVAEVLRPGYRLQDRVLRPAMVVVEE